MANDPISTLKMIGNKNEQLACRVLEKNGIRTVNDLIQFINEYKNWDKLMERFRGMGPLKLEATKEMIKRAGLINK